MALTVGTNSYISVADANSYFADRMNSAVWDGATAVGLKDKALIQATQIIDNQKFIGLRTNPVQDLAFPRFGIYIDNVLVDSTVIPKRVKDATCELAIWVLQSDFTTPDELAGFSSVQLGPIKVDTKSTSAKQLPPMVVGLLRPFITTTLSLVKG